MPPRNFVRLFPGLKPHEPIQKRGVVMSDLSTEWPGDGVAVSFRAQITGYQGVPLSVFWTIHDATTNTPYDTWPAPPSSTPPAPPLGVWQVQFRHDGPHLSATAQEERLEGTIYVPGRPQADGRAWKVSIEIVDPKGTTVARAETTPFSAPSLPPDSGSYSDPYGVK